MRRPSIVSGGLLVAVLVGIASLLNLHVVATLGASAAPREAGPGQAEDRVRAVLTRPITPPDVERIPLVDLLNYYHVASQVPDLPEGLSIRIDVAALMQLQTISPSAPMVSTPEHGRALGAALEDALGQVELTYDVVSDSVVVTPR